MNNKVKYILDLFRITYEVPAHIEINYGNHSDTGVNIVSSKVLEGNGFSPDLSNIVWKNWEKQKIPFLFDYEDKEVIKKSETSVFINFDVIASAFYLLSGWQEKEYFETHTNDGRFPYQHSIQYKLDIPHIPVVNYYFDIIKYAVELNYNIQLPPLLNSNPSVFLSHDIDSTGKAWLIGSYHELRRFRFHSVIKLLYKKFILGNDAWFNLENIMNFELARKIRASFFFLPRKGKHEGVANADYDIKDKNFQQAIGKLKDNGFEIGLHGSSGTHSNLNRFNQDLELINHNVFGNRFHFLKFDITKTPKILNDAGIKYDSTLGFSEHYGFRNGFCSPFNLYDIGNDKPLDVIEIPLIFMDATLRQKNYLNLSKSEIIDSAKQLLAEIKKFNGVFSILWHNTYFSEYKYTGWKGMLEGLINLFKSEGLEFHTGIELAENYNKLTSD